MGEVKANFHDVVNIFPESGKNHGSTEIHEDTEKEFFSTQAG
jgi:hypothetical protein